MWSITYTLLIRLVSYMGHREPPSVAGALSLASGMAREPLLGESYVVYLYHLQTVTVHIALLETATVCRAS